ncbi:hypothetical protein D3C73_989430 [compost metagenome]
MLVLVLFHRRSDGAVVLVAVNQPRIEKTGRDHPRAQLRDRRLIHAGLERMIHRHFWPAAALAYAAQLRQCLAHPRVDRFLGRRHGKRPGYVMVVERGEECVEVVTRIDAIGIEVPVDVESRRVDLASPQLQQRGNEGMGSGEIKRRLLFGRGRSGLQVAAGADQFIDVKIRRVQAIGVGRVEAGDQLFDVAVMGPRCAVGAMGIKIHDQTRNVHSPMTRRSQQRRKRAFERFQRSLDCLGDVVIG